MATSGLGMYFFEDSNPDDLTESTFAEIHDHSMFFSVHQTLIRPDRAVTMIHGSAGGAAVPEVILDFGPNNALGTVSFPRMSPNSYNMEEYFPKISRGSVNRRFAGSDRNMYTWKYRPSKESEWACTNDRNYEVASYSMVDLSESSRKLRGVLNIVEDWNFLAVELLASLTVMRHTVKHNIR